MGNTSLVCLREPNMTVDAASAVPTGVRLVAVVYFYNHHVLALAKIRSDVIFKRTITIRAGAHFLTVDINGGVHINAIKLKQIFL